jgi:flavorubredoxin
LKLWPEKRWKRILLSSLLVVLIVLLFVGAYIMYAINTDVATELVVENAGGSKIALVLYHPGLSSFAHDVTYAFTEGLVSNGWRVEIATPSIEAPTDLSKYNLLVVASNTYAFAPEAPITRHLDRIGDLEGIQTVLLTLGAGSAEGSKQALENMIQAENGTIVKSLLLYSLAPNEGDLSATELAKQAAQQIT